MAPPVNPAAVILYGPPASGKDTITRALASIDPRYALFRRLKTGSGNTNGYRMASPGDLAALRERGQVLYQNDRYGSTYVVDRPHLAAMLGAGQIPIVHIGQVEGIRAVRSYPADWITVALRCARSTTARRARERGSADIEARLTAWDETLEDFSRVGNAGFFACLDTDTMKPDDAAKAIDALVTVADRAPRASPEGSQPG
jgi:guanylate kinase